MNARWLDVPTATGGSGYGPGSHSDVAYVIFGVVFAAILLAALITALRRRGR